MSTNVGWPLVQGTTVAVTTLTEVVAPVWGGRFHSLNLSLENTDATQTVSAWVQAGPTPTGPWDTLEAADFQAIGPGEARTRVVHTNHLQALRVVASADGAGADVVVHAWGIGPT